MKLTKRDEVHHEQRRGRKMQEEETAVERHREIDEDVKREPERSGVLEGEEGVKEYVLGLMGTELPFIERRLPLGTAPLLITELQADVIASLYCV
jgi:hypothetical protein